MTSERKRYDDELLDGLAAYAIDALDDGERLAIEATLLADDGAASIAAAFQAAAVEYAVAAEPELRREAPPSLRADVQAAAFAARPPIAVSTADACDTHLIESERFELLVQRLGDEQWAAALDAQEFAGWTVRDLHAHVASNEALLAQALGAPIGVPEIDDSNEQRTAAVIERHRTMSTTDTVAEYRRARLAADRSARDRSDVGLDEPISFWGQPMRARDALVLRSFETWTHADDIRRAVGLPSSPPPAPVIKRMSMTAASWLPMAIAATTPDHHDKTIVLDLTGPGGDRYHVSLGDLDRDLADVTPDAVLHIDVVAFCQGVGKRAYLFDGGIPFDAEGELELADDVMAKIDLLAVL